MKKRNLVNALIIIIMVLSMALPLAVFINPVLASTSVNYSVTAATDDGMKYYTGAAWAFSNNTVYHTVGYQSAAALKHGLGLRFQAVAVPHGATIDSAYIKVKSRANTAATTVNSYISAWDGDDASTFSNLADFDAKFASQTTAVVAWDNIAAWTTDTDYDSPDISTVIQEVVDRGGWASGNDMIIFWEDFDDRSSHVAFADRRSYSYDADSSKVIKLYITFTYLPTVTTSNATNVEETSATGNGNITDVGIGNCTTRGFEYDIDSGAPYAFETHENGAFAAGAYSLNITGLDEGELYYYRAYATNADGTSYGAEETFLTKPLVPTGVGCTSNTSAIIVSWTNAVCGGGSTVKTWVQAKKDAPPADRADGTNIYFNTGTTVTHSGLGTGEHWYYRLWTSVEEGIWQQWSDTYASTDCTTVMPTTIRTKAATGVGTNYAVCNGYVTNESVTDAITRYGVDYGITVGYGSEAVVLCEATGFPDDNDTFWVSLTGLSAATPYHFRAKAYDGSWHYGDDMMFATKGSPIRFEYWNTGGDSNSTAIYGNNWVYQTIILNDGVDDTVAHTVEYVRLNLRRTLAPGDVEVSLRHATATGDPTGVDLCSASLSGDGFSTSYTWYQFDFDDIVSLEAGELYAICVRAVSGDAANYIEWQQDAGGGGGTTGDFTTGHSTDGGITWTDDAPADALFEVYGYASLRVLSASVFRSYIEDGDWLIVANTENTFPPYYNDYVDPTTLFQLQLVDSTSVVKGATPVLDYERNPLGLYMSAATVTPLTWSGNYTVRLTYLDGGEYQEYALLSTDWKGSNLTLLDQYMRIVAKDLEYYYSATLLVNTSDKGMILNEDGGVIFARGIPSIVDVRPDMFLAPERALLYSKTASTRTYETSRADWRTNVGPRLAGLFDGAARSMGIPDTLDFFGFTSGGQVAGALAFLFVFLMICLFALQSDPWLGLAVGIPIGGLMAWFGLLPFSILFGILMIVAILAIPRFIKVGG